MGSPAPGSVTGLNIRPATPADAPTIAHHRYPNEEDAAERPIYAAWVGSALDRGLYVGFLGIAGGGEVVAGAGLTLLEWGPTRGDPQPYRARLVNVWTRPGFRRRGLARELVLLCLEITRQRGIAHVSLGTSEMARPLYESLGFRASKAEMVRHARRPERP